MVINPELTQRQEKVFNVLTPYNYSQTSCVVADNIAKAEEIFLGKYPNTKILKIALHAEYVLVQKEDGKCK